LNEFCEAIPRYSSSRGARFKRRIGNLDDEEQQIKWAIGWLDALLLNRRREVERIGRNWLTIERFGGLPARLPRQALDVTCGVEITSNAFGAHLLVISTPRVTSAARSAARAAPQSVDEDSNAPLFPPVLPSSL